MNNFLGGLYFLSLLKAIVAPNTSFTVTTKSGARVAAASPMRSYPFAVAVFLALEIIGLSVAGTWALRTGASHGGGYDILAIPLVVSALANLAALAIYRRQERASNDTLLPGPWIINAEPALAAGGLTTIGSQRKIS
jgi:hypothetical protein